jgi:cytoskeletal protein RodZ
MRPKGHKQSRGQRQAISQGMQAYHARVRQAMADYLSLKESIRSQGSAQVKKSPRSTIMFGAAAVVLVVIGVVAAALLIASREPSRADIATMETQPEEAISEALAKNPKRPASAPEESTVRNISASKTPSVGGAQATRLEADATWATAPEESAVRNVSASKTLSVGGARATRLEADTTWATAPEEAATRKAAASRTPPVGAVPATRFAADTTPATTPHESAPSALEQSPAAVTVTGCLERHDETFRLKDTSGVDTPKSRSWRSGFLKKGSAPIDVVDAANGLHLTDHVGQRVSVTGLLVDREMQGRSLQRVATSCSSQVPVARLSSSGRQ